MGVDSGWGRRRTLAAGAGLLSAVLGGCTSGNADRTGSADGVRTTESTGRTAAQTGGEATSTAAVPGTESSAEGSESDALRLPSLTAPGSPGGPLTVVPPGKVVLLDFFATWCPPCETEMPNLRAVRSQFDLANVHLVSLTQETDQRAVKRFWTENRATWPVVVDPTLTATQRFDVTALPTIVVLASDGTETFRHVGLSGKDRLVTAVEGALAYSSE